MYTNQQGLSYQGVLLFGGLDVRLNFLGNWNLIFHLYASLDDANRTPHLFLHEFQLRVTQEQIEKMFSKKTVITDYAWKLAQTTPFILDWADFDEDGVREGKNKSLEELEAVISE